jgi:hypothetical protein
VEDDRIALVILDDRHPADWAFDEGFSYTASLFYNRGMMLRPTLAIFHKSDEFAQRLFCFGC